MRSLLILLLPSLALPVVADQSTTRNSIYSKHSQMTVEKINQTTEMLRDPTVIVDKLKDAFERTSGKPGPKTEQSPSLTPDSGAIKDPTQMTGSFSEALKRLSARRGGSGATEFKLPEIALAAKTFSEDGQNSSALLSINKKLYFVKPGGNFSFMQDNAIYEIAVESIDMHTVRIRIFPLNETLILR